MIINKITKENSGMCPKRTHSAADVRLLSDIPGLDALLKDFAVVISLYDLLYRVVGKDGAYLILGGLGPFLVGKLGYLLDVAHLVYGLAPAVLIFHRVTHETVVGRKLGHVEFSERTVDNYRAVAVFLLAVGEVPVDELPVGFFFKLKCYHISFSEVLKLDVSIITHRRKNINQYE